MVTVQSDVDMALKAIKALREEHQCWFAYGKDCDYSDLWEYETEHEGESQDGR